MDLNNAMLKMDASIATEEFPNFEYYRRKIKVAMLKDLVNNYYNQKTEKNFIALVYGRYRILKSQKNKELEESAEDIVNTYWSMRPEGFTMAKDGLMHGVIHNHALAYLQPTRETMYLITDPKDFSWRTAYKKTLKYKL